MANKSLPPAAGMMMNLPMEYTESRVQRRGQIPGGDCITALFTSQLLAVVGTEIFVGKIRKNFLHSAYMQRKNNLSRGTDVPKFAGEKLGLYAAALRRA